MFYDHPSAPSILDKTGSMRMSDYELSLKEKPEDTRYIKRCCYIKKCLWTYYIEQYNID